MYRRRCTVFFVLTTLKLVSSIAPVAKLNISDGKPKSRAEIQAFFKRRCRSQPKPESDKLYCPAVLDKLGTCWNHTLAGTTAYNPCPEVRGFDTTKIAEKKCEVDGSWYLKPNLNQSESNYTNYMPCVQSSGLEHVPTLYIIGYSVSILALLVSLVIFFHFKQLACDRVTLHKNLFMCYILNGVSWIIFYSFVFAGTVLPKNPWYCQAVHLMATYFSTASYFWMFSEGLYLLTILVVAFHKGGTLLIICISVGWGLPAVFTIIYGAVRGGLEHPKRCWTDNSDYMYINAVPILTTLCINFIFVLVIFALLCTKLRSPNSPDQRQGRKAAKAILILVPLLGVQYILTLVQPDKGYVLNVVHHYTSAVMVSFQGLFVSILLCFSNDEVIAVMQRRFGQHQLMRGGSNFQGGATYTTDMTVHCNTTAV